MIKLATALLPFFAALACGSTFGSEPDSSASLAVLDSTEATQLIYMREEEKLARDSYSTLNEQWDHKVFFNISRSEQRHMDSMLKMLIQFGIDDPVDSDEVGSFSDPYLSALYLQLMDWGEQSLSEALAVGGYIEEIDIRDLRQAISNTDEAALINAYSNLLAASRNHLRTFVSHIEAMNGDYQAQVLEQSDVDAIVGDLTVVPGKQFRINAGLNDAWYYRGTNGQGFVITVFPTLQKVFLAWFTYETEHQNGDVTAILGDPGHRWLTALGPYAGGQADLEIDITSGGIFDSGQREPKHTPGGSILLQFDDCNSGSVIYDIPSIDRSGIIPIERITLDNVALCEELNAN